MRLTLVKTIIRKVNKNSPNPKIIKEAAKILKKGGVVVYPTETCYGIGAVATNIKAIKKIYKIKRRLGMKPMHIIVSSLKMMERYGEITKEIKFLTRRFMPGPLSIVTRKKKTIPKVLNPKEITFRIPSHPIALALVKEVKKPLTTTSANISNQPPLYNIGDVIKTFENKVEMIIDCGNLKKVKPSTFIDMKSEPIILREGPIKGKLILKELERFRNRHH